MVVVAVVAVWCLMLLFSLPHTLTDTHTHSYTPQNIRTHIETHPEHANIHPDTHHIQPCILRHLHISKTLMDTPTTCYIHPNTPPHTVSLQTHPQKKKLGKVCYLIPGNLFYQCKPKRHYNAVTTSIYSDLHSSIKGIFKVNHLFIGFTYI